MTNYWIIINAIVLIVLLLIIVILSCLLIFKKANEDVMVHENRGIETEVSKKGFRSEFDIVNALDAALGEIDKTCPSCHLKSERLDVHIKDEEDSEDWFVTVWTMPAVPGGDINATVKRTGEVVDIWGGF